MMGAPRFTITNSMTAGLTRIERARGFLDAAHLSDEWIRSMGRRALLLEAHHTTHIEGTQLTLAQAERLLAGESVPDQSAMISLEIEASSYRRASHDRCYSHAAALDGRHLRGQGASGTPNVAG